MKAMSKGAIVSGAGALVLGASLALSSATAVSGAGQFETAKSGPISCSNSSQCLLVRNAGTGSGVSSKGGAIGLYGSSSQVEGFGIEGAATGTDGVGVYGAGASSQSGSYYPAGVAGVDDSPYGYGVYASSSQGIGIVSFASGIGIATRTSGTGSVGLYGETTASNSYPIYTLGPSGTFYADGSGNGFFSGTVTASGGYQTVLRTRDGELRGAGVALTPQATMEDTGTARLVAGEAAVRFDPAFAATVDASRGYQVFLTPNGDTRGLYVAAKYDGGFVVRENERGRSSVYFDYRIVARPHGLSDVRFPEVNLRLPRSPRLAPLRL